MASAPVNILDPATLASWSNFNAQVAAGTGSVVLPASLPATMIAAMKDSYSRTIQTPVTSEEDLALGIITLKPNGSIPPPLKRYYRRKSSKRADIPRPMNAFLLYRQHHHPLIKAEYPDIHNNDICKSTSSSGYSIFVNFFYSKDGGIHVAR
jgi:hypothetical protein